HLPHAVLGGDVTLGKEEVMEVGRGQMWDAMSVAHYVHRFMQAAQGEGSIQLRQRILGGVPKPESKNNDGGKKQGEQDGDDLYNSASGASPHGCCGSGGHGVRL